ncbi:MAG: methyltransferase domain-containing protein [Chlorobiales bacterium]|nr:methyltransferase domain-containing protein [Chlorobiales bacterium]
MKSLIAQFAKPVGFWGNIAGFIMAHRSSNLERIEWAISLLDLQPDDRVLETGFGPGVAIQKMSQIVTQGLIVGVERSEAMLEQAAKRNQKAIAAGQVGLILASISSLPTFDAPFDKVLDVNSFQFWNNKEAALERLKELMYPGGTIALVHQPRNKKATENDATLAGEKFARYLEAAGFGDVRIERKIMKPVSTVCVLGKA